MPLKRIIYLAILLLGISLQQGFSQFKHIGSDTLNLYTPILSINKGNENTTDSLIVLSTAGFEIDDTVMVYCTVGAEIDITSKGDTAGIVDEGKPFHNQGRYAFLLIDSIDNDRNLIILNNKMDMIKTLVEGEVAQLIKIPSFRRARVDSELTAPAWNGQTGGVLAFFVQRTLSLGANIDMSSKGFRGAAETEEYNGACASSNPEAYDSLFYKTSGTLVRAGLKGEGVTLTTFDHMRGKARNINGGGGGNARLAGGGGGSNYAAGGRGGYESTGICDSVVDSRGYGGIPMERYGYKNSGVFKNLIYLGGGGGSGTSFTGQVSSDGGNGGGIVVILADSIWGNGFSIIADGESVTPAVNGAGGGGGGAGVILLDVNSYGPSTLRLRAIGGDGGDTKFPGDTTGPGGGGGGGAYWLAGTMHPGVVPELNEEGLPGHYLGGSYRHGANEGGEADKINNLKVPLLGFIFNTVPDEYTVCSDRIPPTIYAALPKGGDGTYTYEWLDSTSSHTWQPATYGTHTQKDFVFSDSLSVTTWYRRVVTSGILPADTSFRIAVYVQPSIKGNLITASDTVCYNLAPQLPFVPANLLTGGSPAEDPYSYKWYSRTESSSYGAITGATDSTYQAGPLTATTYFVREVSSGACVSTSDSVLVKVWETLTGNEIDDNDTVCFNTAPQLMDGNPPLGGDQADLRYQWQTSNNLSIWTAIPGATAQSYLSPNLTQTTYFRRIVLSGSDDACISTSDTIEVLNIPLITGNTITGDQTVCTDQTAGPLTGSDPGGGYQGLYSYRWESRTLSTTWGPSSGINNVKTGYNAGEMTGDTTWYRRVVGSGRVARDVCFDFSDSVVINVLPLISRNQITSSDTVKCQGDTVELITQDPGAGTAPGGGATQGGNDPTRRYQWETASGFGLPGTWAVIPGADQLNFVGQPPLTGEEDLFFRRIVYSGPTEQCRDTATLKITVHTQITGSSIEPFDSVCFAGTKLLLGETSAGEPGITPVYTWHDLDTGTDLPGSDQEDFTTDPYNNLGEYHYQRLVEIGECRDISNAMQITVMQLPGGLLTDNAYQACEQDTSLAIDLNMDQLLTYVRPWEVTLRNQVTSGIGPVTVTGDGPVSVTLEIGDIPSQLLNYEIESIIYRSPEGRYECVSPGDSIGGLVPIEVFRRPEPQISVDDASLESYAVCNTTMTLGVDTDNGTGSWTSEPAGTVFFTSSGQDEYLASIPNDHEAFGSYQLIFTSEAGNCAGIALLDATFDEQPDPPIPGPTPAMVFLTDEYDMQADSASAGIGTWEVISGGAMVLDPNDPHTIVYGLSYEEENLFRWTIENGACGAADSVMVIYRNEVKRYNGFSPNGDLQNEYYIMQGLPYADEFEISFFNSLGNIVRTITHETVEELEVDESLINNGLREDEMVVWDGRSNNGNLVPSGTYYYVIKIIRGTEVYEPVKDYVVVQRD